MTDVGRITASGTTRAVIIRSTVAPAETSFITRPEYKQQVEHVESSADGAAEWHMHLHVDLRLVGESAPQNVINS